MLRFVFDQRVRSAQFTRRQWLAISSLAGLGLSGISRSAISAERTNLGRGFGRAKSVIIVFASGGQSHIDMWDPKPNAPLDVRGEFQPIPTAIAGVQFTELMPRIAAIADRLTLVRSMSHEDIDHGTAVYLALTGRYHTIRSGNPPPGANDHPTFGAILRRVRAQEQFVADAVHLNGPALVPWDPSPGQNGGFLGRSFEPLVVGDVRGSTMMPEGLSSSAEVPAVRMSDRLTLKQSLDHFAQRLEQDRQARDMNRMYRQAFELLFSPQAREAFNLAAEPDSIRDRYGRHRSGQACLLARRLVEAGVPYINVIWNHSNRGQDRHPNDTDLYGWDTHNDIFDSLRHRLVPRFDESFSALIEDLDERGLLGETLVICMGEFGRAPRVALEPNFKGSTPGRKHWATVYSIVFAGAGVQRGAVVGASDRLGAEPITERYAPWDVAATIFHALGIDPTTQFTDSLGRPFHIADGSVMAKIYG